MAKPAQSGLHLLVHGGTIPSDGTQQADPLEARRFGRERLAIAFRIMAHYGLSLGIGGHLTFRDPVEPDRFWVNPLGVDFSMMTVGDLVLVRDDGTIVVGRHSSINGGGYSIHSNIHRARRDVHAAVHAHSPYGSAFAALRIHLPPISQEALSFYGDHGLYNSYGGAGVGAEGERIAAALGPHKAVICANHGLFTVGRTMDEAVFWFVRMERACHQCLLAMAAGTPVEIDAETSSMAAKQFGSPDIGRFGLTPMVNKILKEQPDVLDD